MNRDIKLIIVDYNLSNLFSVERACKILGYSPIISSNKEDVLTADAVILPGVGAFNEAMKNLNTDGLTDAIVDFVDQGKPFMGVCLGLQLLFEKSEEFGESKGLGLIKGAVKKFPVDKEKNIKVPQISWNKIYAPLTEEDQKWRKSPLGHIQKGAFMYFVHSYYAIPSEPEDILTVTTYGNVTYCSGVLKKNIFATQFHPEKSGEKGLSIYQNWLEAIS